MIPTARLTRQCRSYPALYPTCFVYSQACKWQYLVTYWLSFRTAWVQGNLFPWSSATKLGKGLVLLSGHNLLNTIAPYQCDLVSILSLATITLLISISPPSSPFLLSAVDPPRITTQPLDMSNVIPGSTVMFTVAASGLRLTYIWMQNGSALSSDGRFVAANEILTIQSVMPSDVGSYSCVVSNPAGNDTSNPASLTLSELVFVCFERWDHTHLRGNQYRPQVR